MPRATEPQTFFDEENNPESHAAGRSICQASAEWTDQGDGKSNTTFKKLLK